MKSESYAEWRVQSARPRLPGKDRLRFRSLGTRCDIPSEPQRFRWDVPRDIDGISWDLVRFVLVDPWERRRLAIRRHRRPR